MFIVQTGCQVAYRYEEVKTYVKEHTGLMVSPSISHR